eukprot:scaffold128967_cov57-Phaeocystis_antarctica.AAC.1
MPLPAACAATPPARGVRRRAAWRARARRAAAAAPQEGVTPEEGAARPRAPTRAARAWLGSGLGPGLGSGLGLGLGLAARAWAAACGSRRAP